MCGGSTMRAMAPNANIQQSQITGSKIPAGHRFDRFGAAMMKHAREKADPKTRAILEGVGKGLSHKEQTPPKKSSPPSGGPTRLGIRRSTSTRKRGGVSGRSRSRSKAFSTKR